MARGRPEARQRFKDTRSLAEMLRIYIPGAQILDVIGSDAVKRNAVMVNALE